MFLPLDQDLFLEGILDKAAGHPCYLDTPVRMLSPDDFSTNRSSPVGAATSGVLHVDYAQCQPVRHSDLCFDDGNLAVLTGATYFLVHQGLLSRHSAPLAALIEDLEEKSPRLLEGRLVLELPEPSADVYPFLLALYDGM